MSTCICKAPESLAMASVPKQKWCEPYDLKTALEEGTIFPCLNLPFFKAPKNDHPLCSCSHSNNETQNDRESMMTRLMEISFALNDLTLYLDMHPGCEHGLSMFHSLSEERLTLLAEYAKDYYPLTQASMITGNCDVNVYGWGEGPAPWEGACI